MRHEHHEGVAFNLAGSRAAEALETTPGTTERQIPMANLLDLVHDAFFVRRMDSVIRYWNRAAEKLYGWTSDEAVGNVSHGLLKTLFPAPLEQIEAELVRAGRWEGELVHTRKDGTQVTVASRWSLQHDKGDAPVAIIETNNDITDRKQAEQALRDSEQRYRHIFQTAGVSIWEEDFSGPKAAIDDLKARGVRNFREYLGEHPEFVSAALSMVRVVDVNDATLRLFGADSKHDLMQSLQKVFAPETLEVFAGELIAIAEGESFFEGETVLRTLNGQPLAVLFTIAFPPPPDSLKSVLVSVTDITERKRGEEALRRREKDLRDVIETIPAMAWMSAADRSNVFVNKRWTDYTGVSAEHMVGGWRATVHPDDVDRHVAKWHASMVNREPFENEVRLRAANGGHRWFLVRAVPVKDERGNVLTWYGMAADIEDRKRAEEERAAHLWFLESMDRINRAMQATNDLEQMMSDVLDAVLEIFACDRAWLVYPCDPEAPSWRAVMEHTRAEFPGAFAIGTDLPVDAEVAAVFRSARASRGAVQFGPTSGLQVPPQVAERFSIRSQMAMAIYPKVDKAYLFGLHQCSQSRVWTAQEQRLFEEIGRRLADSLAGLLMFRSLRESEAKLEEAQHMAHVGYSERDFGTNHAAHSDECCRIFGLQAHEAAGDLTQWHERWLELIHPDDRARLTQTYAAMLQDSPSIDVEYRIVRPNGDVRVVQSRGRVTRDESGRPKRLFGMTQDITELREAEEELRASEARFRTFVDHATDAFMLHRHDATVVDVNQQACESLGYSRQELIGMTPMDFDPDANPALLQRVAERVDSGEIVTFETRHRRKDGTIFPVEVRLRAFRQGDRRLRISLIRDITERRHAEAERLKLEERLRQAEKMEAIGRFASGIAHDFNNVLGGIVGYAELLFNEAIENTPRKRYAQNVLTAATRGRDLVDQILAYTRSQRGKRAPTDICRGVAETLELLRSSLPANIALHATIPDESLVVIGNATQVHQIVMNLCSNSIQAMKAGGPLRVAITALDAIEECALSHGTLKPGGYVRLSVEDGGCGMDEATLARIFEPFFTTKEVGRGTGLGLALVYAIVTDFGGAIDVKSTVDEGTTFSIYMPLTGVTAAA